MTASKTFVPLTRSLDIPFNRLVLSQANVRQVKAGVSIEDLSEDIARRGLLTSLNVRPILDANGAETGDYEIPAGGRRYRAIDRLVKAKRLPKTAPIPCTVKDAAGPTSMEDDSLAENTFREALHPLDQYRAFLALRRQNMSEDEIAARYYVSPSVVNQRLRLAAVSPVLLELYANEELTLQQLMAFSVTGDHVRQEQLWDALSTQQSWQREPHQIRRQLTDNAVEASDRRAVFVGAEAYEAAGGVILRDLFSADNGGWLQDGPLLDRLVQDKLDGLAEALKPAGWKWIEVLPSLPFDHLAGLRKLEAVNSALGDEDKAALEALRAEQAELEAEYEGFEELPDEVDERLGELETAIEALEGTGDPVFAAEDMARAGVVVTLGRSGDAQILRGYVRPEDEVTVEADREGGELDAGEPVGGAGSHPGPVQTAVITLGAAQPTAATDAEDDEDETLKPLPERLLIELTAYRTVALREAVATNPRVAMTLLLHKLVADTFQHRYGASCLQVSVHAPSTLHLGPKGLGESIPAKALGEQRDAWGEVLPYDDQALWDWLDQASDDDRLGLLAFCVSIGMNAMLERPHQYGGYPTEQQVKLRLQHADRVAVATRLDLVGAGWQPTAESYLSRVPKPRILEAVREACGERQALLIAHLKKGDMVVEAERLLTNTGWLPEILRMPTEAGSEKGGEPDALPAFLAGEGAPALAAE
jgi:ParB family chromosome partitioning protein